MILNNKKAVIGTTLTWIVAILIIIFVLVIYFITLNLLVKCDKTLPFDCGISQSKIISENKISSDRMLTNNLVSFVENNEKVINDWANSDLVISREEFATDKIPEDKKILYDKVYNSYVNFIKTADYKSPYFYIRTEKKEMQIGKAPGPKLDFDGFGIRNPTADEFFYGFEANIYGEREEINRFYFISDKENKIMVVFYD